MGNNIIVNEALSFDDVLLVPSNGKFNVMLIQYPLGASLFTKLFYLDGFGTKYFEKFDDVQSATGVRVSISV